MTLGCASAGEDMRAMLGVPASAPPPQTVTAPAPRPRPLRADGIAAGPYHTCIWGPEGIHCWGPTCSAAPGGLRLACSPEGLPSPDTVQMTWTESDTGELRDLCTLRRDASVWCWSADEDPARAARRDLPPVTRIVAGTFDTCALLASGRVRCWGHLPPDETTHDVEVSVEGATTLDARGTVACAGTRDRTFVCWRAQHGEATALDDARGADALAIGHEHAFLEPSLRYGLRTVIEGGSWCTLREGALRCWGPNREGTVGDGTSIAREHPVPVTTDDGRPFGPVVSLAIGLNRACAVVREGAVACWGSLGEASPVARGYAHPRWIAGLRDVVDVVSGYNHVCARSRDGLAWCWGANRGGVLGAAGASEYAADPVPLMR